MKTRNKIAFLIIMATMLYYQILSWFSEIGRTEKLLPYLLVSLIFMLLPGFSSNKRGLMVVGTITLTLFSLALHDFVSAKNLFIMLLSPIVAYYVADVLHPPLRIAYYWFFLVLIPYSLYAFTSIEGVFYLPNENWQVDFFGINNTKHLMGLAGSTLVWTSVFSIKETSSEGGKTKYIDIILGLLGSYMLIGSTARSYILPFLVIIVYLLIFRHRIKQWFAYIYFTTAIMSTYMLESISSYASPLKEYTILDKFTKTDNFGLYGVTSGRAWLWALHLKWFQSSNYIGKGSSATFNTGDTVDKQIAKAASESVYTGLLAIYGFMGIVVIIAHISLFVFAVKKNNLLGSALIFFMIYVSVLGDFLMESSAPLTMLLFILYVRSFSIQQKIGE